MSWAEASNSTLTTAFFRRKDLYHLICSTIVFVWSSVFFIDIFFKIPQGVHIGIKQPVPVSGLAEDDHYLLPHDCVNSPILKLDLCTTHTLRYFHIRKSSYLKWGTFAQGLSSVRSIQQFHWHFYSFLLKSSLLIASMKKALERENMYAWLFLAIDGLYISHILHSLFQLRLKLATFWYYIARFISVWCNLIKYNHHFFTISCCRYQSLYTHYAYNC